MTRSISARLLLMGDTNIQGRDDPASAFERVRPLLQSADGIVLHLECPIAPSTTDHGIPDVVHKPNWRHGDPSVARALTSAGISAVSVASNVMHPGRVALSTVAALDAAGVAHCGAGADRAAARRPAIFRVGEATVGVLGYTSVFWLYDHAATDTTPGSATLKAHTGYEPDRRALEMPGAAPIVHTWPDAGDLAAMEADIRALKKQVDVVILSCHWGVSSSHDTCAYQRDYARAAIAAGADLIFGHHPHVIQGAEIIDGRAVFYSLGNFAFDWWKMRGRHPEGLVVEVALTGRQITSVGVLPVARNGDNDIAPAPLDTPMGEAIATLFERLCQRFGTVVRREGEQIVVLPAQA